jgi:hypothetical protein
VTRIYFLNFWLGISLIRAVSTGYIREIGAIISTTVIFLVHLSFLGSMSTHQV